MNRWPDVDAVLVGASAGGVDALLKLCAALPADFPVPLLLVLHRPASGGSLAPLLASRCALPLSDAWDKQPLRAGEVLLAPADYHMLVAPGPCIALSRDAPLNWSRPAIDPLFESATDVFGARLLGVILTGANTDGALGARALRQAGGELWVQNPKQAIVPTMPQAALDLAGADLAPGIEEIGHLLGNGKWR
ncbi:chemotaxis protein CheB [Uliginosibacterium paludis]|uniref:protein-glutamate methylesterase n=1 Tax=Uliginosibacterium paludis TaxID=1615952 RepID=A0ABV2CVG2_9RHOO